MGVVFYKRVDPFFNAGGGVTVTESFEYEGSWSGTIQGGDNYPNTFTGFNAPSASSSETFEYTENWPGTISEPLYSDTFTEFNTPSASLNETFELSNGWGLTLGTPSPFFISLSNLVPNGSSTISVGGSGTETLTISNSDSLNFFVSSTPSNGSSVSSGNTINVSVSYVGMPNPMIAPATSITVSLSGGSSQIISGSYAGGGGPGP